MDAQSLTNSNVASSVIVDGNVTKGLPAEMLKTMKYTVKKALYFIDELDIEDLDPTRFQVRVINRDVNRDNDNGDDSEEEARTDNYSNTVSSSDDEIVETARSAFSNPPSTSGSSMDEGRVDGMSYQSLRIIRKTLKTWMILLEYRWKQSSNFRCEFKQNLARILAWTPRFLDWNCAESVETLNSEIDLAWALLQRYLDVALAYQGFGVTVEYVDAKSSTPRNGIAPRDVSKVGETDGRCPSAFSPASEFSILTVPKMLESELKLMCSIPEHWRLEEDKSAIQDIFTTHASRDEEKVKARESAKDEQSLAEFAQLVSWRFSNFTTCREAIGDLWLSDMTAVPMEQGNVIHSGLAKMLESVRLDG